ncbi:MAG TPA: hypothetical protein VER11_14160, partial [Polyangiaceae bacterium]|nr:hypothetical protein [Polyangiaceae bacterium]
MKHVFGAAGVLSAILFAAGIGHATDGWVQIPGLATQIAVGANDMPFILDINGNVQYLAPPQRVCTPQNLCVEDARHWTMANATATVIGCDQYGFLWKTDAAGRLSKMGPSEAFNTSMYDTGIAAAITSLAPGRQQPPPEWNYPFGISEGHYPLGSTEIKQVPFTTTYLTTSGSPQALLGIDITTNKAFVNGGPGTAQWDTHTDWQSIDTGELQVTQFTIDNSADQVPWFFVYSTGGYRTPYAMP